MADFVQDPADVQAEWARRIRDVEPRTVDAWVELLDKPAGEQSLVERMETQIALGVMQALARRPIVLGAVGNVAQVYELREEGMKR